MALRDYNGNQSYLHTVSNLVCNLFLHLPVKMPSVPIFLCFLGIYFKNQALPLKFTIASSNESSLFGVYHSLKL